MYNKKWTLKHKGQVEESEINQILKNRGIESEEDKEIFMNPSLDFLRDPFLMKDMDKAVKRIENAIENNETIFIYGDYDVDGVSSTSILCLYFDSINYPVSYYIPNRLEEGYGINEDAIRKIHKEGCSLLISVDCGITSVKEVELANELGIDVIITDHHECQSEIPNAYAVINPKQEDCNYPFDMLCGCGVALKLIQALTPKEVFKTTMYDYLEIATLATICDIVPLVDENRIIVKNGLKLMREGKNLGLRELIKICGVETDKIGSSHIGFAIGPRINASGRLGYSYLGVQLFTTKDEYEANEIAKVLEEKNNERQLIEAKMYQEAEEIIQSNERYENDKVLVIAREGWQHGIIGIVASKLTEKYYKPTILLTIEDGEATGSARSIKGFSIFDALVSCKDLLNKFGGHEQAAGLGLDAKHVDILRERVNEIADYNLTNEDMIENIKVEFELDEDKVSLDLVDKLHDLEPFGLSNPSPRFIIRNLVLDDMFAIGKNKQHLKLNVYNKNTYECIGFNMAHLKENFNVGDKVDILFQLDENNYMNNRTVQLLLKDIRLSHPKNAMKDELSLKLFSKIVPNDANNLYTIKSDDENIISISQNGQNIIEGSKDINVFDYLKGKTLIITNTVNGFYRSISDVSLLEEDFDINFRDVNTNKNNIQVIFSSNIDKIDLKRYNNIVLYDYLHSIKDYAYIYEGASDECNIIKYYNDTDKLYLKNIIDNIIPERQDFIIVYKLALVNKSFELDILDIKKTFNIMPLKLFTILNVFKELSLLDFNLDYDNRKIFINLLEKPNEKLNLDESIILNNLKDLRQQYLNSY